MPNNFFLRLEKYYTDVAQVLRGESAKAAIFPNPTDVGDTREDILVKVLQDHLPSNCIVSKGGFLFNLSGEESKQIDILVNSSQSLRFSFDPAGMKKTFACIDGCIGVVSVKSNLTKAELVDSLDNLASIPEKSAPTINPMVEIRNYSDWPYKIIFASKGASYELVSTTLADYYEEHPDIPNYLRPNYIYVAGKYLIYNSGNSEKNTRNGKVIPPYTFVGIKNSAAVDKLALCEIVIELQERASASNHIIFNYGPMINNLATSDNDLEVDS